MAYVRGSRLAILKVFSRTGENSELVSHPQQCLDDSVSGTFRARVEQKMTFYRLTRGSDTAMLDKAEGPKGIAL
jgi:hypothetical protein